MLDLLGEPMWSVRVRAHPVERLVDASEGRVQAIGRTLGDASAKRTSEALLERIGRMSVRDHFERHGELEHHALQVRDSIFVGRGRLLRKIKREKPERVHGCAHGQGDDGDALEPGAVHRILERPSLPAHLDHRLGAVDDGLPQGTPARRLRAFERIDLESAAHDLLEVAVGADDAQRRLRATEHFAEGPDETFEKNRGFIGRGLEEFLGDIRDYREGLHAFRFDLGLLRELADVVGEPRRGFRIAFDHRVCRFGVELERSRRWGLRRRVRGASVARRGRVERGRGERSGYRGQLGRFDSKDSGRRGLGWGFRDSGFCERLECRPEDLEQRTRGPLLCRARVTEALSDLVTRRELVHRPLERGSERFQNASAFGSDGAEARRVASIQTPLHDLHVRRIG